MEKINMSKETLFNYMEGNLPEEERLVVERWIDSTDENRLAAEKVWHLVFALENLKTMQGVDVAAARKRVHRRMCASRVRTIFNRVQRAAAILFIPLVAVTAVLVADALKPEKVEYVEMRTTPGTITTVTLPDDTQVWLNANSWLKYPTRFGKERNVELVGEAYFKVTRDESRRFNVATRDVRVEVLGTEFNIEAYADADRKVRTTLVNGKVDMHYLDADNRRCTLSMSPDQCAVLDRSSRLLSLNSVNTALATSWREGKIILDHTPLADVLRMVENHFNVKFNVKNHKLYDHTFTGVFSSQSLDVILDHFRYSSHMRFTVPEKNTLMESGRRVIEVY